MTRKWIDCRDFPDETGCTLDLSGEEDHVIQAAAEHAISFHGAEDTPELRDWHHSKLQDEAALTPVLERKRRDRSLTQEMRT